MQDLQTFSVVLRDENERFVKEFISELGLNHLCRLGQTKRDMSFDKELLTVFKAIIDTERTVTSLINHDLVVRLIVQKIDSKDARVRELALQLLVSFVAIDTDMTERAVTDIMSCMLFLFLSLFLIVLAFCFFFYYYLFELNLFVVVLRVFGLCFFMSLCCWPGVMQFV